MTSGPWISILQLTAVNHTRFPERSRTLLVSVKLQAPALDPAHSNCVRTIDVRCICGGIVIAPALAQMILCDMIP